MSFPWLTVLMAVPLVGAAVVALLPRGTTALPKQVALAFSLLTLVVAAVVGLSFEPGGGYQLTEQYTWIAAFGAHYALGVDGIGLTLVLLTAVLTPVVILASWSEADGGRWSVNSFFAWMLGLEALALGVFTATDVFLFYVLFEATLIPIYFLIGGYGGAGRSYAAVKFLLYNLFGGLVMLASVVGLYIISAQQEGGPSYLLSDLMALELDGSVGRWLFLGFFIAFAIKAPMVPLHTWLPDASAAATPGTAVLMVSVLDKIGTFGMLRLCLGVFPEASQWATPVVLALAVVSILYGGLVAIAQDGIRRLIAFTSVQHMGFIVLGIFVLNSQGQSGATLYMFNHGISTALLFLGTGFLISRHGSPRISDYGGVEKVAPVLSGLVLVAALATLSLPGLSPFVSELLVLVGAYVRSMWLGIFAVLGIVLAAVYSLLLYQRLMTGPTRPELIRLPDLQLREMAALAPLVLLLVLVGFYPKPLLNAIDPAVADTLQHVGVSDPKPVVPASATPQEGADQ